MSRVARYGKAVAREGRGGELAELLLAAADELDGDPGCELYLINRQAGEPDIVWVSIMLAAMLGCAALLRALRFSCE